MQLETTRFGMVEIDENQIITLTQPIIGFQDFRRFIVLPGPEDSTADWLQSTEASDLAFIVMDPRLLVVDYTLDLSKHEMDELAISAPEELDVYTLVVVPKNPKEIRTNLKAPILINAKARLGKQTILEKSNYPIRFYLAQAQDDAPDSQQEAANARSNA